MEGPIVSMVVQWWWLLVVIPVGLWLISRWIINVPANKIAILEQRYVGKRLPPGRIIALSNEIGILGAYLPPGLKINWRWPIIRKSEDREFVVIRENQIGLVTALDGAARPNERIFAEDKAGATHNNFQDPIAFLTNGGIRGTQLRYLTSGAYKLHPQLFEHRTVDRFNVPEGMIAVITANDGAPLETGQLFGKTVTGHNNFQDPEAFIKNGGQKGQQIQILPPGTYNLHREMFTPELRKATDIKNGFVGVAEAKAGQPMDTNDVVAAAPDLKLHDSFQDGQAFLDHGGRRGIQDAVLQPGRYYINPLLFEVKEEPVTVVKQGQVAALIAHVGRDPSVDLESKVSTSPVVAGAEDPEELRHEAGVRGRHVVPKGYRGIQMEVLQPGNYPINPRAYTAVHWPTTTRSLEWSENEAKNGFDPFLVISRDGFDIFVSVRLQYRILPENVPYVMQKLGTVEELEKNVVHPLVDGIFRAQVSKSPALNYQKELASEQAAAEKTIREAMVVYKVEVVSVVISHIKPPKELMHITQQQNQAELEMSMYDAQKQAEERRIELESTKAKANQQATLMEAEVGVKKAEFEAQQKIKTAEGEAKQIELVANARANATKVTGTAEADVIEAKGLAQAKAYQEQSSALTPQVVGQIQVVEKIAAAGLKITPDIVVGSGGINGGSTSGMVDLLIANMVREQATQPTPVVVKDTKAETK